ncbi:DUF1579 domain-containing protein [Arthrobacter sp. SW1]|uniref:DUF1579 family protein n=1 Tax=Arthrobacter sp. SW1 TaxID=1920889 RepID=UPI000877B989|nr:DUF1579 family protein [Arthrobacter sp. SW1]OFI36710.1 DUF1579 domain-containing protein [Arthrobacter sp. SW1]
MREPHLSAAESLAAFLGHWRGSAQLLVSPSGPARTVDAELVFTKAAGGHAVVQSYVHRETDGSRVEGHGVFTVDPDHGDTLWYYVDSAGKPPEAPARGHWNGGTLTLERHSPRGTLRHSFRLDGGELLHSASVRMGTAPEFARVLHARFRKV